MGYALELAQEAGLAGEVPVGAVITDSKTHQLIATGQNRRERDCDPTAHAEIVALRIAAQVLQTRHLHTCTLYVTLEPCPMCAGALIQSRIGCVVYGVDDPKTGTLRTVANLPDSPCSYHSFPVWGGIRETECRQQLQAWFAQKRSPRESPEK